MTVRPAEAAIVRSARRGCSRGSRCARSSRDLNERGVPTASGGAVDAADACAGCSPRPRISGQREHHGEIVATAEWPAIISGRGRREIRALLADPERRTNKTARRYLLGGLLAAATAASGSSPAPLGRAAPLRLREGAGLLRLRQDLHQRRHGRAFVVEAVLHPARLAGAAARGRAASAQRTRTRERWLAEVEAAQAQLEELAAAYGETARSRWPSGAPRGSRSSSA